jgi:histidine ammonia-lyase
LIEDHATNATLSVDKAARIVDNCRYILAIELLTAAQAIDLRGRPQLGTGTAAAYAAVRSVAPFLCADELMAPYVEAVYRLLCSGTLVQAVNRASTYPLGLLIDAT